jgi:DNA-binding response OmpR family regulator
MSVCLACGAAQERRAARGPLATQLDPPGAWWHGRPLPPLSPRRLAILHLLCQRGAASHLAVQIAGAGADAGPEAAATQICMLRKLLPPGLRIASVHGWGYRLVVGEKDAAARRSAAG